MIQYVLMASWPAVLRCKVEPVSVLIKPGPQSRDARRYRRCEVCRQHGPSFVAQMQAQRGCQQVVWLDLDRAQVGQGMGG